MIWRTRRTSYRQKWYLRSFVYFVNARMPVEIGIAAVEIDFDIPSIAISEEWCAVLVRQLGNGASTGPRHSPFETKTFLGVVFLLDLLRMACFATR